MTRNVHWRRFALSSAGSIAILLFAVVALLAAARYAALTRFSSDPALAPRDVAVYKDDVTRVAGAGFLRATKVGQDQIYAIDTVSTIGGVIFQETAAPAPALAGKDIELLYNRSLPDGQRLVVKIDGNSFKVNLFDWALIPISYYANSPYTAVLSLLGKAQSPDEATISRMQRSLGKRFFWVETHPDLRDTLIGFNAILADAMFLIDGDPRATRKYTESLTPKISGWNASGFDEKQSADAADVLQKLLAPAPWDTYIFTDLGCDFAFTTVGDELVVSGRNPTYHFFSPT
jgi:hypothetical protein